MSTAVTSSCLRNIETGGGAGLGLDGPDSWRLTEHPSDAFGRGPLAIDRLEEPA